MTVLDWKQFEHKDDGVLRFALLGDPVDETIYPPMILATLQSLKIAGEYFVLRVPSPEFEQSVMHLAACGFLGLNITLPHKARAARIAERYYEVKHNVGVANALKLKDGIWGMNTEVPAFLAPIKHIEPSTALVLGSGPAARTAITALLIEGWRVKVWNKNAMKSRLLRSVLQRMGDVELIAYPNPAGCSLIVNATRIGMRPGEQPPMEWKHVKRGAVAYDFVFRRVPTEFLRSATSRGLKTIDGREMAVEKAALALEWWIDKPVPREAMKEAVGLQVKS
jgi:shikimate dehydrogenase